MKIVFFGTPPYVLPILDSLNKNFRRDNESAISAVVTQSPKPVGRSKKLEYSAVDKWAFSRKIPRYFDSMQVIEDHVQADIGILASYGNLIPVEVLNYFPQGILVIHPSLLPQFRWASPVPATIITGTNPTGVTIFRMDKNWDTGPIVTQFKEDLGRGETAGELRDRLFLRSAEVLVHTIPAYISGKINTKTQDSSKASFARLIKKEDSFIPPSALREALNGKVLEGNWEVPFITINHKPFAMDYSPASIQKFMLAMQPWPGAWTYVKLQNKGGKMLKLKLLKTSIEGVDGGSQKLIIEQVQLEGKNPVSWSEFQRGYPNFSLDD